MTWMPPKGMPQRDGTGYPDALQDDSTWEDVSAALHWLTTVPGAPVDDAADRQRIQDWWDSSIPALDNQTPRALWTSGQKRVIIGLVNEWLQGQVTA
jgi:hypothetical protein